MVVPDGGINALSGLQDHTTQAHTAPCANAALMWLTPALPWPPSPRASRDEAARAAGSPEGGRANPAQRKAAQRQREIAGAQHQGHRHHDQIAVLTQIHRFCTQIRAPATAIKPKTTIEAPPITGPGMVWINAPNFGEKPNSMAISAAATNTSVE